MIDDNIYGQFNDLQELYCVGGQIAETDYLRIDDYVRRGLELIEMITSLFCQKVKYADHITFLRGNHAIAGIFLQFGFRKGVIDGYSEGVIWNISHVHVQQPSIARLCQSPKGFDEDPLLSQRRNSPLNQIPDIEAIHRLHELPLDGDVRSRVEQSRLQLSFSQVSTRRSGPDSSPARSGFVAGTSNSIHRFDTA
jgi:hypothetical protein